MQGIFGNEGRSLGETIRQSVAEEVRASGERVLWQSEGSSSRSPHPDSHDRHGLCRYEVFTYSFLSILSASLGALAGLTAISAGGLLEPVVLGAAAIGGLYGAALSALWSLRSREAVRRDSSLRCYILTSERLVVVGTDSFVEVPLSEILSVRSKRHLDGSASVSCVYVDVNKKTIALESVEKASEVKKLLEDARAAIKGRELRQSLETGRAGEEAARR